MSRRKLTVGVYEEVLRLLELGLSVRTTASTLKCSRSTVRAIRDGRRVNPFVETQAGNFPLWTEQVDWKYIREKLSQGDTIKDLWNFNYSELVGYSGFYRQVYRKFPNTRTKFIVHRYFNPGEYSEVDYAGMKVEWLDKRSGEIHEAPVFTGILNNSQIIYATAKCDMTSRNFIECHKSMYEYFGGVPVITVPDCLKQGVKLVHLYDPDINESYNEMAKHYGTAIVPARVRRPQDKALVESAVKLVQRFFKYFYKDHLFTSVKEINDALLRVITLINDERKHSTFKTTRRARYEEQEKAKLKPLPLVPYEYYEWKEAKVHPDSHIHIHGNYYSVPYVHRCKKVKVRVGQNQIEVFINLERIALHERCMSNHKRRITSRDHLPENAKAYYDATPVSILSKAKNISVELYNLIDGMFKENTLANLRRTQGLIDNARKELIRSGETKAVLVINKAVEDMRRFNKIRVPYFRDLLVKYHRESCQKKDTSIERNHNNPMLRYSNVIDISYKNTMEVNLNGSITVKEPNVRT